MKDVALIVAMFILYLYFFVMYVLLVLASTVEAYSMTPIELGATAASMYFTLRIVAALIFVLKGGSSSD